MKKRNIFPVRLIILIISLLLVDGGKTFILLGENIHTAISHHHERDLETPLHLGFINIADDEKWIETGKNEISSHICPFSYFSLPENFSPQFYPGSVWQPPKSV
jgi:hypothetical protein